MSSTNYEPVNTDEPVNTHEGEDEDKQEDESIKIIETVDEKYNDIQHDVYGSLTRDKKSTFWGRISEILSKMYNSIPNLPSGRKILTVSFFSYRKIVQTLVAFLIVREKLNSVENATLESPNGVNIDNDEYNDHWKWIEIILRDKKFEQLYIAYISCYLYSNLKEKKTVTDSNLKLINRDYFELIQHQPTVQHQTAVQGQTTVQGQTKLVIVYVPSNLPIDEIIDYVNLIIIIGNINCVTLNEKLGIINNKSDHIPPVLKYLMSQSHDNNGIKNISKECALTIDDDSKIIDGVNLTKNIKIAETEVNAETDSNSDETKVDAETDSNSDETEVDMGTKSNSDAPDVDPENLINIALTEINFFTVPKRGVYPIDQSMWKGNLHSESLQPYLQKQIEKNNEIADISNNFIEDRKNVFNDFCFNLDAIISNNVSKMYENAIKTNDLLESGGDISLIIDLVNEIYKHLTKYTTPDTLPVSVIAAPSPSPSPSQENHSQKDKTHHEDNAIHLLNCFKKSMDDDNFWGNFSKSHKENTYQFPIILANLPRTAIFVLKWLIMKAYNTLNIKIHIGDSNVVRLYFLQLVYEKNYRHMCADLHYKVDGLKDSSGTPWLKTSFDEASRIPKSEYDELTNKEKERCESTYPAVKDWAGFEWRGPKNKTCRYRASTRKTDEICDRNFPAYATVTWSDPRAGIIRKTRRIRCKRLLNAKRKMIVDGISCKKEVCNNVTKKIEAVAKDPSTDKDHYLSSSWLHNAYQRVKDKKITTNKQVDEICNSEFPILTTKNAASSTKRWQCKDLLNKYINSVRDNNDCNPPAGGIRCTRKKKTLLKCKPIIKGLKKQINNIAVNKKKFTRPNCKSKKHKCKKVDIRNCVIRDARKTRKMSGGNNSAIISICWGIGRIGVFIMLYLFCLVGMGMGVANVGAVLAGIGLPLGQPIAVPALEVSVPISFMSWFFFAILLRINYEEVRVILYSFQVLYKWVLGLPRFRTLMNSRSYYSDISKFLANRVYELHKIKESLKANNPINNTRLITLIHIFYIFKIYDWDNGNCIQYVDRINTPFLIDKIKNEKNFNDLIKIINNEEVNHNDLADAVEIFIKQEINPLLLKCLDLIVFIWKMTYPVISGENKMSFGNNSIFKYKHTTFLEDIDQILSLLPYNDMSFVSKIKYILSFKVVAVSTWAQDLGTKFSIDYIVWFQRKTKDRLIAFSPKSFQVGLLSIAADLGNFSVVEKLIYTQSFLSLDEIQYFKNRKRGDTALNKLTKIISNSDSWNKYTLLSSICVFTVANINPFRMAENIYFTYSFFSVSSYKKKLKNDGTNNSFGDLLSDYIRVF